MEITVTLWGNIPYHSPVAKGRFSFTLNVEEGTTAQKLVENLKLPDQLPYTIVVNGITIESEHALRDGDEVALFAPFSGG